MKRCIAFFLAMTFVTSPAFAGVSDLPVTQPVSGETPVGPAVSPIRKGQIAPFSGVLLSPEAVAKIVVDYNNQKEQTEIEAKKAREEQQAKDQLLIDNLEADLRHEKEVAKAQVESRNDQLKILNRRIEEMEKNKPNVTVVAGLSAVAGAAVVILSIVAVNAAK